MTIEQFMCAVSAGPVEEMRVLLLEGPRGEGKTSGVIPACLALADRLVQEGQGHLLPIRVAVVRDTFTSLLRTTVESFKEQQRLGLPIEWKRDFREAFVGDPAHPALHISMFGVDTQADVDDLQGFQCGVLVVEEPAPASGLTAGVPQEIFGVGATSVRQAGIPPRILIPMNPPDADAWIRSVERYLLGLGLEGVRVHRFEIPQGEKDQHFRDMAARTSGQESEDWAAAARQFQAYRKRNRAFLESIGRHDLVRRLVEGREGEVQVGEPVLPATVWSRKLHVAAEALPTFPSLDLILMFDGGATPSCVVTQDLGASVGCNILGSHTLDNASMEELIRDWLLPFLQTYKLMPTGKRDAYGRLPERGYRLRAIGDPSLQWEGKTAKAENTSGLVIQEMLGISLEPGPVEWAARREAMIAAFNRPGRGDRPRFIQIDPTENDLLIKALAGRFRYPKDIRTGKVVYEITAAKNASGLYGQTPDALFYGLAVLYPAYEWLRANQRARVPPGPPVRPPKSFLGA